MNVSKAKVRLFHRSSGNEILSGDLYNLIRRPSKWQTTCSFINDLVTWYDISGDFFISCGITEGGIAPQSMVLLDPYAIQHYPINAISRDDVTTWIYTSRSGYRVNIPADYIIHGKLFNPYSEIRGLSPLVTGVNEVAANYQVTRFNRQYLENGAVGSLAFRFPKGTNEKVAKEFINTWSNNHSSYYNNAFTMAGLIGDEIQIEDISGDPKDGQFLQLSQLNDERIAQLFKVPASESGNYSKTRFDSIEFEQESFAENTLMPLMTGISEVLQTQLVDRYFPTAGQNSAKGKPSFGKNCRKAYEEAMEVKGESDVIILLDPDTLPIMGKLLKHKVEQAIKMRSAFDMSANEVAEHFGIELPPRVERDTIYIPTNVKDADAAVVEPVVEPTVEPIVDEAVDTEGVKDLHKKVRIYRGMVVAAVADKKMFDKSTALALVPEVGVQVHKDWLYVKALIKGDGDILRTVKDYLNTTYSKATLRGYCKE